MLSPRTQALMQGQQEELDAESMFRQAFQDLLLQNIRTQMPDLVSSIVAVKILEVDPKTDSGKATVILERGGQELQIPAVLTRNELAPLDMMYSPQLDSFMPLSNDYINEVASEGGSNMGAAVPTPEGVASDRDIRNLVIPPTTGRYSYASDHTTYKSPQKLYDSSNATKTAILDCFKGNEKLAAYALNLYGEEVFRDMLTKRAQSPQQSSTAINVFTLADPVEDIQSGFDGTPAQAMSDLTEFGYVVSDTRPTEGLNAYVLQDGPMTLEDPTMAGFYHVYYKGKGRRSCLVFTKVFTLSQREYSFYDTEPRPYHNEYSTGGSDTCKILLCEDNSAVVIKNPISATLVTPEHVPPAFRRMLDAPKAGTPRNGQRGFFADLSTQSLNAVEPFKINNVHREGTRLTIDATTYTGDSLFIIQDSDLNFQSPRRFSNLESAQDRYDAGPSYAFQTEAERKDGFKSGYGADVYIPSHYKFVPVNSFDDPKYVVRDASAIMRYYNSEMRAGGSRSLQVKTAGSGYVYVENDMLSAPEAVKHIATDFNVHGKVASAIVTRALSDYKPINGWVYNRDVLTKVAQGMAPPPAGMPPEGMPPAGMPPEGMPPEGMPPEGMPPAGMPPAGMPPEGMPPMPPPEPPPVVAMAAQEVYDQVMTRFGEVQKQLAAEQDSLQLQIDVLESVLDRATQIQDAFMTGAPPPEPLPPLEAPAAPMPVDPYGGMPPEAQPLAGAPGGAGLMGSGAQEAAGAPVPEETAMAMESAADLQDPELFDATLLTGIAQQDNYNKSVAEHGPELQETMDHVGRLLFELRANQDEFEERFGAEDYAGMLDRLEKIFENTGAVLLEMSSARSGEFMTG